MLKCPYRLIMPEHTFTSGGTGMAGIQHYNRIAAVHARNGLQKLGYHAYLITGRKKPFDLIAWRGRRMILCIRIKRSRTPGITQFSSDVSSLSTLIRTGSIPGNIELWIQVYGDWFRYRIYPGGALLKR